MALTKFQGLRGFQKRGPDVGSEVEKGTVEFLGMVSY